MKAVIVSPEILGPHKGGDIGTFATHWAQMLRDKGEQVVLIYTGAMDDSKREWMTAYEGIEVIHVTETAPEYRTFNYESFVRLSEAVSTHMPQDADVIYFQDWLANGFRFLRQRKFNRGHKPVCVTVTHSSHQWILESRKTFPSKRIDVELSFTERYQVENSDFIASPSQYMLNDMRHKGWKLPPQDKIHVLGYPFPRAGTSNGQTDSVAKQFKHLIFYGNIETHKGLELFVDALHHLQRQNPAALASINRITLLGRTGTHRFETLDKLLENIQESFPGTGIQALTQLEADETRAFLAQNASNSLVVAPSLADHFPYSLIEASLIPNLNLICSSDGGQAEILGEAGRSQLFETHPRLLAEKLAEKLSERPRTDQHLGHYDWQAANRLWLEFHDKVCRSQSTTFQVNIDLPKPPSVDVCMAYFNHAPYLPSALKSLAHQTTDNFNLYVINDGSTDPEAQQVFEQMIQSYAQKSNWHFVNRDVNRGLSETRNQAVSMGSAEYLLFMDADNIAAPQMVERFAECMQLTDYDCLTCNVFWFEGDDAPFLQPQPDLLDKPAFYWPPLGNSLELGLFQNCWGDANFIVKRSAFEAIGKFRIEVPLDRYRTGEDTEILARLSFAGYKLDVIPEVLFFYRHLLNSLNRTGNAYDRAARTLRVYSEELQKVGLQHLVPWIYQLYRTSLSAPKSQVAETREPVEAERIRYQVYQSYEYLKQDPEWIADNIPWRKVFQGMVYKLTRRFRSRRE